MDDISEYFEPYFKQKLQDYLEQWEEEAKTV